MSDSRLTQTTVVRCANGHYPISWYSRRDQPVPCPVCGRVVDAPPPETSR